MAPSNGFPASGREGGAGLALRLCKTSRGGSGRVRTAAFGGAEESRKYRDFSRRRQGEPPSQAAFWRAQAPECAKTLLRFYAPDRGDASQVRAENNAN